MPDNAQPGAGNEGEKGKETPQNQNQSAGQKDGDSGDQNQKANGSDELDDSGWDDKTRKYIEKLRNENASHRTKNKDLMSKIQGVGEREKALKKALGIEDESDSPEKKIEGLTANLDAVTFRSAILQTALEHGISNQDVDYLGYRIEKAAAQLGDNEEISEDDLADIINDVKARAGGKSANSSVNDATGGKKSPQKDNGAVVNLDKFVSMTMTEKSKLYATNPELYNSLMKEARRTNRLV